MKVLIAEDERRLADMLSEVMQAEGWLTTICSTGRSALAQARLGDIDVMVLDWGLPGLDGPAVLRALRADGHRVPVLMLTARTDFRDRVEGLDGGADDYLTKPFDVDELLARLRALYRRSHPGHTVARRVGDLFLDPIGRRAMRGDVTVELSAREFDILLVLVQRAGQVVDRYTILDEVWDGEFDARSNVIDVHVATLRSKIDKPFGRTTIQTVRGVGYRVDPGGA